MGRVKVIDKGPRNIDLDILLYDDLTFFNERLQIPHKLMLEREFVLRPLCEYALLPRLCKTSYLSRTELSLKAPRFEIRSRNHCIITSHSYPLQKNHCLQ